VIALFFTLCALPPQTAAQDQKRVVVMPFKGPSGAAARKQVVQGLKQRSEVEIVPASQLKAGGDLHEGAAEAQVSAIIEGTVAKKGKLLEITVSVRDADSGEVVHEEAWTRKKPQLKKLHGNVWKKLGPHIQRTRAPEKAPPPPEVVEPEPEPVAKPEPKRPRKRIEPEAEASMAEEPQDEKPAKERSALHPALVVSVGPRLMWRSLVYEGPTTLSSYSSYGKDGGTPAFNLALSVLWFPGAHWRSDFLSNFGLEGDIDYSIGLKSKQGDRELGTTAYEFAVGALYRFPLDAFEPRVRVGYVTHTFDVDVPTGTPLPAVSYSAVRGGLGCVVNLVDAFGFDVNFGALIVLDAGEIGTATYAEKLSAFAWEAGGGATVRFKERYGIRMGADFRRYNLDFGGSTNATWVLPKKANDDYLRATLSFIYALPGAK
jgi:TolB-like protein